MSILGDDTHAPGSTFTFNLGIQTGASNALRDLAAAAAYGALFNSAEQYNPPRCHPYTRTKYIDNFELWMLGKGEEYNGKHLIWLTGGAGAGKSAILHSIVDRCARHTVILGTFSFSRSDPARNHANVLIPTLAYQVALAFPAAMAVLEPVIQHDPPIFTASLRTQAYELLVRPIRYLIQTGIIESTNSLRRVFVVDGLDECTNPQDQALIINIVASILCEYRVPVHFLIAGRPEPEISNAFQRETCLNGIFQSIILDNDDDARSDIRKFIEESFVEIIHDHPLRDYIPLHWPGPDSVKLLASKSSGHFIYAATVMRYIACTREYPVRALEAVKGPTSPRWNDPFKPLDALYMSILSRAHNISPVLGLLRYCYLTEFETSVEAMCYLYNISPEDVHLALADILSLVSVSTNSSGDTYITPKHASLVDFLTNQDRSQHFYIGPIGQHRATANTDNLVAVGVEGTEDLERRAAAVPAQDAPTPVSSPNEPGFTPESDRSESPSTTQTQNHKAAHSGRLGDPVRDSENHTPTSTSENVQDERLTREGFPVDLMDPDERYPRKSWFQHCEGGDMNPATPSGPGSHSSAGLFTNAQVDHISGGTFVNVAHIYESGPPELGGGPAFPIAVLGLHAVSFATRSHYPYCNYPLQPPPLIVAPPSTLYIALSFSVLYREAKLVMAPLTLMLLLKMWIERRARGDH